MHSFLLAPHRSFYGHIRIATERFEIWSFRRRVKLGIFTCETSMHMYLYRAPRAAWFAKNKSRQTKSPFKMCKHKSYRPIGLFVNGAALFPIVFCFALPASRAVFSSCVAMELSSGIHEAPAVPCCAIKVCSPCDGKSCLCSNARATWKPP